MDSRGCLGDGLLTILKVCLVKMKQGRRPHRIIALCNHVFYLYCMQRLGVFPGPVTHKYRPDPRYAHDRRLAAPVAR